MMSLKASLVLAFGVSGAVAAPAIITILGPAGTSTHVAAADVTGAPEVSVALPGKTPAVAYAGPLLWQVLEHAGALPASPREQAGEIALVTGADGYSAAVALGEIAPDFAGKPVILADKMGGMPLPEGRFRLVVPGDGKGARSVRDVVRIAVIKVAPRP